jgi:hypothetical protein
MTQQNLLVNQDKARDFGAIGAGATSVGAAGVAVIAATCCVSPVLAPLIVGLLGASGAAWAAGTRPYRGVILSMTFVLLAMGFWATYRRQRECAVDSASTRPKLLPALAKIVLWAGAVCWVVAVVLVLVLR